MGIEKIEEIISKEAMEQYETVRQSGVTNMFDYYNVMRVATECELYALGSLSLEDYKVLILNFSKLMKHYDIKQPE